MLVLAGLCADAKAGEILARRALDSGQAAERFARMVSALGGPRDVLAAKLPKARVVLPLPSPQDGVLVAMDTREVGLAVVELGGGRRQAGDGVDVRVGLSHIQAVGARLSRGDPLMQVHAQSREAAHAAMSRISRALRMAEHAPPNRPVVIDRL
jgi:thymidine phosphorylase